MLTQFAQGAAAGAGAVRTFFMKRRWGRIKKSSLPGIHSLLWIPRPQQQARKEDKRLGCRPEGRRYKSIEAGEVREKIAARL